MRVVCALSGGVDSAVAAALLKQQGYEVIGVHLRLFEQGSLCCGSAGYESARRLAGQLGIPFYVMNLQAEFEQLVINDFCAEYRQGRTPNPCIRCNRLIKFGLLRQRAVALGAEFIATGHYARIVKDQSGRFHLYRGVDPGKEQSYFLYHTSQEQLAGLLLPVGAMTKGQVRMRARELGLPNAERPESQEICFIPDNDYARFLKKRHPEFFQAGPVYDLSGRRLGTHSGIVNFTIGQRKGLGLALGERRYVVRIDPGENAVYLGTENDAYQRRVWAGAVHWIGPAPAGPVRVWAKVRYQSPGGKAVVNPLPDFRVYIEFDEPQWAPTPGQAVVLYDGDEVLGGGTIEASQP
ncbi:MAG: tRNA 2-thiouridine(34) synthase MnmA [candidate division WOR-3 bacterium]|jgi:tRNA-specific 2-thiouridylase